MLSKFKKLFGPINNREIIETDVRAEIKATTEEPIYSKSYPYPINMRSEVDTQIEQLLNVGPYKTFQKPRQHYNLGSGVNTVNTVWSLILKDSMP